MYSHPGKSVRRFKRLIFAVEHLHPAVRHGADCRYAVIAVGDGTGGRAAAADVGRTCTQNRRIIALRPAGAELHNQLISCRADHAVCFCCHQRLVVDSQQNHRFHQLCLDDRTFHGDNRLVREDGSSLFHCPNVAGETKVCKVIQELFVEHLLRAQVFYIVLFKAQILKIATYPLESADYRISAGIRVLSEEHVEIRDLVAHIRMKIASSHGKLIEIREKCKMLFVEHTSVSFLF
mgnify:CR=1 FL=1